MSAVLGRRFGIFFAFGVLVVLSLVATAGPAWSQVGRTPVQLSAVAYAGPGGGEFFDTATLSGGTNLAGTVTFQLFGPDDHACAGPPVFTSARPVAGVGTDPVTVESDHVLLPVQGVYHFVAAYSGDALHLPAGPTDCLDPNQAVGFASSFFAFSAEASPATTVGGTVSDRATITTSSEPTGTMTFRLYGPEAAGCTGMPVFTWTMPVDGNGTYSSGGYTPTRPGIWQWVATYSGDADDPGAESSCGDPSQQVEVSPAPAAATPPSYPCAVLAQQRAVLDGQLQALRQSLAASLDPATAALVGDALSSSWGLRVDARAQGMACG